MYRFFLRKVKRKFGRRYRDIDPEDIFLDSTNLPGFDEHRFEGRIEKPMHGSTFTLLKGMVLLLVCLLGFKLWDLGINKGHVYADISENNRLSHTLIFANRGVIYDRNDLELAGNAIKSESSDFAGRVYPDLDGLSHVVGYLKYPLRDSAGFYYDEGYRGRAGAEQSYDALLAGKNGLKIIETDVAGSITSESVIERPQDGKPVTLSIDARVSDALYDIIESTMSDRGFIGGAGVLMDVETGELLALVSAPEYNQSVMTEGKDRASINTLLNSPSKPFLNRVTGGLYTPGSILKPIVAMAALNEGIISPEKEIESRGSLVVPNPYDPSKPSVFGDWKAHGWTDMREALAVSSDVYFYAVGGGHGDQKGLGIDNLNKYFRLFGLTEKTGIDLMGETKGIVPSPEWKAINFDGDIWRLGDTYITAIGQYGTQVTPIESVRFISAIANGGELLVPSILRGGAPVPLERLERAIELPSAHWQIVREGMRQGVTYGTSVGLNMVNVEVAAKTGTAEIGSAKRYIHSWSVGFFPYDNPRYAFTVIMEHGPADNPIGATSVMRRLLDWMTVYTPEYLR